MAVETLRTRPVARRRFAWGLRLRAIRLIKTFLGHYRFSSITRRILVINFLGVAILVAGILYLNEGRVKYTQTRVENLSIQASIIAKAVALRPESPDRIEDTKTDDYQIKQAPLGNQDLSKLSFSINPEIAPVLSDLAGPTKTRARIYDAEGNLLFDSRVMSPRAQIGRPDSMRSGKRELDPLSQVWNTVKNAFYEPDLPLYKETGSDGKAYEEVKIALSGTPSTLMRVTEDGETVISVGIPIQRQKTVLGVLLLTDQSGSIDDIIAAERWQVIYIACFVIFVTGILSWLLAGTIAEPMRRLAFAAERVRKNIKTREQIPDFGGRSDEIGYLSRALKDMTNALYLRIDAIGSFAADVSHELKNPLTSLRNAASMLPKVQREEDKQQLIDIILHDVRRLDRLITDISDASRLDAELARETAKPVNIASLLFALCDVTQQSRAAGTVNIVLRVEGCPSADESSQAKGYFVNGHGSRLGQVITNLLDNAISFSPVNGSIYVSARRLVNKGKIEITIEDEGPGISDENFDKIFQRFYTDRPEPESFGQNSGLGLNISQQIVEAHRGRIWAENRTSSKPIVLGAKRKKGHPVIDEPSSGEEERFNCGTARRHSFGAKFVVRLPAIDADA